jgi:3-isopropylmalate/(R)-2-methylmalate dehydratase small subunit
MGPFKREPFTRFEAVAAPMPAININTDSVLPGRFLRKLRSEGFGQYCFYDERFDEQGKERPGFVLNKEGYRGARILVAGANFGCGSSRDMAVWAVGDYGIRALIAPSFGDIFSNNCAKNGLLTITLKSEQVDALLKTLAAQPGRTLSIDLENEVIEAGTPDHPEAIPFRIDPFTRKCLLAGLDPLDYTLQFTGQITAYEKRKHEAERTLASGPKQET